MQYGREAPFIGPLLWKNVSKQCKISNFLDEIKNKTKTWIPENCLRKICKTYFHQAIVYVFVLSKLCFRCFCYFSLMFFMFVFYIMCQVDIISYLFWWFFYLFCIHYLTLFICQLQINCKEWNFIFIIV